MYLHHRTKNDIWKGLYDFPLIETETETSFEVLCKNPKWKQLFESYTFHLLQRSVVYKHQLTHQTIYAVFYHMQIETPLMDLTEKNVILTHRKQLDQYPFPRLIDRFLVDAGLYG